MTSAEQTCQTECNRLLLLTPSLSFGYIFRYSILPTIKHKREFYLI